MDFHPKQWRTQQYESEEEEQNHSAKIPKLLNTNHNNNNNNNNPNEPQFKKPESPSGSVLPLFVHNHHQQPQLNSAHKITTHLSQPPRMGSSYFSLAQWQELELQALIFRYMVAGATVPVELLSPIKKSLSSLLNTPQYFLHHQHPLQQHYQPPALFQSGYLARAAMDPEPGRCRRTDGKKWRCSRDVVVGQKYCERHMHRGRHRSRKPVETPTLTAAGRGGGTHSAPAVTGRISGAGRDNTASVDILRLGRSSSEPKTDHGSGETKSEGHVLRHFFDDWPRSRQEGDNVATNGSSLSISMQGNLSSDVALKLSTGDAGWGSSPMGGPLAEALRSSSSNSPTSVLQHQLQRGSAAETCTVGS